MQYFLTFAPLNARAGRWWHGNLAYYESSNTTI